MASQYQANDLPILLEAPKIGAMERNVKIAVIGAGTAGHSALKEIRKITDDFVLIQDGPYGTTCARVGCMPSKVLIQVAHDYHRRHFLEKQGIRGGDGLSVDRAAAMAHVRTLRDYFVQFVLQSVEKLGDKNIRGRAHFVEPTALKVGNDTIRAEKIVIATGSSPVVPGDWKAFGSSVVTTDQFFELEDLPNRVGVVGMGVIGTELGQALSLLGIEVVGVGSSDYVAGAKDPVVNKAASEILSQSMKLWLGDAAKLSQASGSIEISAGSKRTEVDLVLASLGRRPNVKDLGLESIGVELDERGIPKFNSNTQQIGNLPIYIAGDVDGARPVLHEAADDGAIAGYNSARDTATCFERRAPMGVTFMSPPLAFVGNRYQEDFVVGEVSYRSQGRATIKQENEGLLRVYACAKSEKLMGAELCCPGADHMAHTLAWSFQQEMKIGEMLQMPFYHPVLEEGLRTALRDLYQKLKGEHSKPEIAMCDAQAPQGFC